MCSAYSGNCTISNYTSGRDSNRGGCVQSCRFYYSSIKDNIFQKNVISGNYEESEFNGLGNKKFIKNIPEIHSTSLFSSKDLRGMRLLPQYIENEVDSIKVEGRMKSALMSQLQRVPIPRQSSGVAWNLEKNGMKN